MFANSKLTIFTERQMEMMFLTLVHANFFLT